MKKSEIPVTEVEPDASDDRSFFKLPKTRVPEPLMRGIRGWKTGEGYLVLRCHYTCDPDRATEEWLAETSRGYRGGIQGRDWMREMEIDFGSYSGLPVYSQFDKDASVKEVKYNPSLPLWRGWDFGYRNPAVVFLQLWPDDTLVFLHEIFPTINKESLPGISTADLARLVLQETQRYFPAALDADLSGGVYDFTDPAGNQKKETSDFSSIEILQQHGIDPETNVVGRKNRIEFARPYVEGKHEDGRPRFLINAHCALGIEAFSAAYRYPDSEKGGQDREMPDLSRKIQEEPYIHIMDAFEYVVACNLEITYQTKHGFHKSSSDAREVTDLATAYLGTSAHAPDRVASVPLATMSQDQDLEKLLNDLIGEETLDDAWELL